MSDDGEVSFTVPAYQIPLTEMERTALGEICVIQGQIEHLMNIIIIVVSSMEAASGQSFDVSSSWQKKRTLPLGASVGAWITEIKSANISDEHRNACLACAARIKELCENRNDFFHATYGAWIDIESQKHTVIPVPSDGSLHEILSLSKGGAARRTKTNQARSVRDIITLRNECATLSVELFKIESSLIIQSPFMTASRKSLDNKDDSEENL